MTEPVIADVLAAIGRLDADVKDLRGEVKDLRGDFKVLRAETRTEVLEVRAQIATLRLDEARHYNDVRRRLATLCDELSAFRAEYNAHTDGS